MPTQTVDIDSPYQLSDADIRYFREQGYVKLKEVFDADVYETYEPEITRMLRSRSDDTPLEERGTYGKAFQQVGNIWCSDDQVKAFVFSKRLARIAAELMGCTGVRIYHDQALYKEAGGGFTPWHADQQYWPLSSDKTVTAWIPLQPVSKEMGPLAFAKGSHKDDLGRSLEISDDSEAAIRQKVIDGGYDMDATAYDLGEVSFHYGWTFHRAEGNDTDTERKVMTVIYMDEDMRVKEPENGNQKNDLASWLPGLKPGDLCNSELSPVIWSSKA